MNECLNCGMPIEENRQYCNDCLELDAVKEVTDYNSETNKLLREVTEDLDRQMKNNWGSKVLFADCCDCDKSYNDDVDPNIYHNPF